MTRQRLSKEERKKQIKKAALGLFIKNGYCNTSIQNVVDKANYSKGGFYNCYSSKLELFKDILEDSLNFRESQMKKYQLNNSNKDRKTILIELFLDKLLDSNNYKKLFVTTVTEMRNNPELYKIYKEYEANAIKQFVEFCKREGYEEFIKITNNQMSAFMSSIIVGTEIFDKHDDSAYRQLIADIMRTYFDKINFFDVN